MNTPLTQEVYCRLEGEHCPNCQSTDIKALDDSIEIMGDEATQYVECGTCNASWRNAYTLTRYGILKVPPFINEGIKT